MPWRHPNLRAQQVAPKGFSGEGSRRRRDLGLSGLPPSDLRSAPGAWRSRGSRASRGSAEWWPASSGESSFTGPGVDVWSPQMRLPPLPTVTPRAGRSRTGLRSVLLPPRPPSPEECEDSWRGSARKTPGSLGSLLGEFLPRRFREFLNQLGAEWVEQPQPPTSSKSPHRRGVSECWQGLSPLSPDCSFLPDPRSRSLNFQNSLKKSSLEQIPTLRPLGRDQEQFTKVKKATRPHGLGLEVPKPQAEPTHSSSEEGSGHHRRGSPFRVRFADETLWDTAFRYWERRRARKQTRWGAPNSRKVQPAPGRADLVALGAGRKAPAHKAQKAAEPGEEAPELAPPEDVRVTFEDEVEGLRSGRSVPKQVAPGSSHSIGPENHGCPDLATAEGLLAPRVLTGRIHPPQNRHPQPSDPYPAPFQQDVTQNRPATQSEAALERAFGSVGRWVESLPKALDSQAKEAASASSPFSWNSPSLPIPALEDYLSEDTSMNSGLPYTPRATTRQQRDRKTFLGTHSILDQVGKLPYSWSQKLESFLPRLELQSILNRGRPKGYQLLLPSGTRQQAQR